VLLLYIAICILIMLSGTSVVDVNAKIRKGLNDFDIVTRHRPGRKEESSTD